MARLLFVWVGIYCRRRSKKRSSRRILNEFEFVSFRVTKEDNPAERWHMFTVRANERSIDKLAKTLKPEKWYAHFWNGDNVIAVFPGKTFRFKHSDQSTWNDAVDYGLSLGIPSDQLDFVIEK